MHEEFEGRANMNLELFLDILTMNFSDQLATVEQTEKELKVDVIQ